VTGFRAALYDCRWLFAVVFIIAFAAAFITL